MASKEYIIRVTRYYDDCDIVGYLCYKKSITLSDPALADRYSLEVAESLAWMLTQQAQGTNPIGREVAPPIYDVVKKPKEKKHGI